MVWSSGPVDHISVARSLLYPRAMTVTLADVKALLDGWYDPAWAEAWDAVGLVCGDPAQPVRKVLFAVDPAPVVVAEALEWGADLVVCHHPLLLTPVHGVAATTPKGRVVHDLVRGGTALLDRAHQRRRSGRRRQRVARARRGRRGPGGRGEHRRRRPRQARRRSCRTSTPTPYAPPITAAGAGAIGDYDSCTFTTSGEGRFRPLDGATPAIGSVGETEVVDEVRIESVMPRRHRGQVVAAMHAAHPYEEVAYDVLELARVPGSPPASRGHGRIGRLAAATTLRGFVEQVVRRAARDRPWRPCRRRPRPRGRDRRGGQRVRRLHARHRARHGRRRLPHLRPAPPPGG